MQRSTAGGRRGAGGAVLAALAALAIAGPLAAQGFGIYEQGSCVMGRANAAVAAPCEDGSSIFFNPAAIALLERPVLSAGVTGIFTDGRFEPDEGGRVTDLETRPIPVPHFFFSMEPTEDWGVGVGIYAPYGLETRWPLDFEGRFVGYDNALRALYGQPTVAWRPADEVSFGAGLTVVWSEVEINRRVDLATTPVPDGLGAPPGATFGQLGIPPGTDFADVELEGASDGPAFGAHLAMLAELRPDVRVGIRYLTSVDVRYDGDAEIEPVDPGIKLGPGNPFGVPAGTPLAVVLQQADVYAPGGPLADQGVATAVTMPWQLVVGLAWDPTDRLTLAFDWQYTGWESFDTVRIAYENEGVPDEVLEEGYRNTSTLRLGAEWEPGTGLTLRGGWIRNEAAAPDATVTPLLPEGERDSFTAGIGWDDGGWAADVGYLRLVQGDRRGRVRNPPPGEAPTTALSAGVYGFSAHLVGITLVARF